MASVAEARPLFREGEPDFYGGGKSDRLWEGFNPLI